MPTPEQTRTRNTLTAILLYELSRLDQLPLTVTVMIASELTATIQTLRMSQVHADQGFHQNQAAHFSEVKRNTLERKNQSESQVRFAIASIMHCIHKGNEVEGLQNELIASTMTWVRESVTRTQT
jgi:hypothetical protein